MSNITNKPATVVNEIVSSKVRSKIEQMNQILASIEESLKNPGILTKGDIEEFEQSFKMFDMVMDNANQMLECMVR